MSEKTHKFLQIERLTCTRSFNSMESSSTTGWGKVWKDLDVLMTR